MMAGVKDPERYTEARTWAGRPVVCISCGQAGVPTWTSKGWQMPEHGYSPGVSTAMPCPGSGAAVEQPEHQTTKRLREQAQHVPEAKGLTDDEDPMGSPK